jgi:beta-N-acetylhexosaminidase
MQLTEQIAQKIILDLRYYCAETSTPSSDENQLEGYISNQSKITNTQAFTHQTACRKPLTQLPIELAQLIKSTALGGVILFADNLVDTAQIITLTSDLQNAALDSTLGAPLFIAVDQEGGRVVRLPRHITSNFSGNMAIGATYEKHGVHFAYAIGKAIGYELNILGFNVNFAPTVDVNINPDNPVINVRSFGENPQQVAQLGVAMLEGMQSENIIATLKHFPGHGDTNIDSHTGLPCVEHDKNKAKSVDLYPFHYAIEHSKVDMIMTAHIQYPALDNSVVVNKQKQEMLKPATLSKEIITKLLREKMHYQGIVVSDALDMAGISQFFSAQDALIEAFRAGVDIAVMPIKIRNPADIKKFKDFLTEVANIVQGDINFIDNINASIQRIKQLKHKLAVTKLTEQQVSDKITQAKSSLKNAQHQQLSQQLAQQSIVEIQNKLPPNCFAMATNVVIIFPEKTQAQALHLCLENEVINQSSKSYYLASLAQSNSLTKKIQESDLVIIASNEQPNAVDLGGIDDLTTTLTARDEHGYQAKAEQALQLLRLAKNHHKKTIFIHLQDPYKISAFKSVADRILACFNGDVFIDLNSGQAKGTVFNALALLITDNILPQGKLPITIK